MKIKIRKRIRSKIMSKIRIESVQGRFQRPGTRSRLVSLRATANTR
jgi:hypothetical protein